MTTQQYLKDPRTGRFRPVVYLDQHGRPVEPPPGSQVLLAPSQASQAAPPAAPQAHPLAQPTMPTHTPFLPPGAVPQRYKITVQYDMGRRPAGESPAAGGLLLNTVFTALGFAMMGVAVYLLVRFVAAPLLGGGGQAYAPIALPQAADILSWGADTAHEFSEAVAGVTAGAPETPPEAPVLGVGVLPQDLGDLTVKGPPSISAALIDEYLAELGSPAAGTGADWYMGGMERGIDPVFGVAFFMHESGAGLAQGWAGHKPDGSSTHNVGNIICAGYATCFGRFRDYPSWREGIADWYRLIDAEYLQGRGHQTVADIIPVYAPSVENDVGRYIEAVRETVIALRQREQQRQQQTPPQAEAPAPGGAQWVLTTPRLRVNVTELREQNGETHILGSVTNTSDQPIGITLEHFDVRGATGTTWFARGSEVVTIKPGETAEGLDIAVPVVGQTLTLIVAVPPDPPVELELGQGQVGAGPAPGFAMTDQGPVGCPVQPTAGRVVMTQGYGVGSHAPAAIWGGIDLAVDGDGDEAADIAGSVGQPIVATHAGTVKFTPNSYPGGNYVMVTSDDGVWRSEYGHLAESLVQTGQHVQAGEQIGIMGRTGLASGEHLHYVVWQNGANIDPTALVGC